MVNNCFRVNSVRKNVYNENVLVINGCFLNGKAIQNTVRVLINGKEVETSIVAREGYLVTQRYIAESENICTEYNISVDLRDIELDKLVVENIEETGEIQEAIELSGTKIRKLMNRINYNIDKVEKKQKALHISGWVVYKDSLDIVVVDSDDNKLEADIKFYKRTDIEYAFPELEKSDKEYGFNIKVSDKKDITIIFHVDGTEYTKKISKNESKYKQGKMIGKVVRYYRRHGLKMTCKRIAKGIIKTTNKIFGSDKKDYKDFIKKYETSQMNLEKQKKARFNKNVKFSIVIPLYNTPENYLKELIDSIAAQTYSNYEICFADGSDKGNLLPVINSTSVSDKILYKKLDDNKGISENTNAALELATGDYIVLADHDDLLAPNALYELAKIIDVNEDADVVYSDEDKISMDGKVRFEPHFKPDFNIDLLTSVNYICHLFAVSKSIVDKVGRFNSEYDGAQDYDFILRCVEEARNVYHIPKVLYHWRCHMNSTAANPESKLYAFEAGKKAIKAHFDRVGIEAVVEHGPSYGLYRSKLIINGMPKVSILIPNKDHIDDLELCINSIIDKTTYDNYEIIIIENNSVNSETFDYYKSVQNAYDKVKVVTWEREFNYSLINNFGAEFANGEYLLFLNNDTEVINGEWLEEMLSYCMRRDVGIVGARLYYPDDTIQHAGVVIGFGGIAGHTFIGQGRYEFGYFARAMCIQDYSAVTAACMMTKKSVFDKVGGFSGELKVAFNDIDYCMKVRKENLLVVYNPYAELYHYESKSRGLEDTPEKIERFNSEIEYFREKWNDILEAGDPYYNVNLTLDKSDFSLRS